MMRVFLTPFTAGHIIMPGRKPSRRGPGIPRGSGKEVAMKFGRVFVPLLALLLAAGAACKKSSPTSPDPDSGVELSGQITLSGGAFAGCDVYLSWGASQKTTTASDGRFAFKGLEPGNYFVTPAKAGYSFNPSQAELGATRKDLVFAGAAASPGTDIGAIALDFTAKDQNGTNVTLSSSHGKVVLLDFTADWCTECRAKAETADAFYKQYKDRGFMYLLVVIEGSASNWASTYGLTFPVLDDNSHAIYNQYRKTSIPLPHVLDRNLTIRYKKEGWNKAEVEDLIKKLL
jgi:peroxiredoxin